MRLKLDEPMRARRGAKNSVLSLEDLTEEELEQLKARYYRPAEPGSASRESAEEKSPAVWEGASYAEMGRSPGSGNAVTKASTA